MVRRVRCLVQPDRKAQQVHKGPSDLSAQQVQSGQSGQQVQSVQYLDHKDQQELPARPGLLEPRETKAIREIKATPATLVHRVLQARPADLKDQQVRPGHRDQQETAARSIRRTGQSGMGT